MVPMVDFALVVAGSEASGGAGIQADLKTFQQLGVHGSGALTCIVSFDPKNDWGHRFVPVDAPVIADQIEAATAVHDIDVVKIGMLGTPVTIETVARELSARTFKHVVLDPVLICKGQEPGAALDTDTALREKVLPLATVVTPNLFETKTLAGVDEITTVDELIAAAQRIHELGVPFVVAKGGVELPGPDAVDVLVSDDGVEVFSRPKIGEERVSGAGCTFAAAITAELAKGALVRDAVAVAKDFVTAAVESRLPSNAPFTSAWQGAYAG